MKLTVRRIAEEAGVSPATVSRYLNRSVSVSDELSGQIETAIENMGGPVTFRDRKRYVFVLMTQMGFLFYGQALKELLSQKTAFRFIMIHYDPNEKEVLKEFVTRFKPVGALYFEEEIDAEILAYLQGRGVRTIMFGGTALHPGSDMVRVNDLAAAYEGAGYLLRLGHRDILFLSDEIRKISSGFQRITGCRKALEEKGLSISERHVYYGEITFAAGYSAVCDALDKDTPFTAVFAFSDELAVGAMAALQDRGRLVPQDVSVLGFDDLEIAKQVRPGLTTIHQPIDLFVQKVIERLESPREEKPAEIVLPYSIVERESCRPV